MTPKAANFLFLIITVLSKSTAARFDPDTYPACITDSDCQEVHNLPSHHVCFKYFCYPGHQGSLKLETGPLKSCQSKSDCPDAQTCFKQPLYISDGNERTGVCLTRDEGKMCLEHGSCSGNGSLDKCCKTSCCSQDYFQALKDLPCKSDTVCQMLRLGDQCCIDVMSISRSGYDQKCCDNPLGPVTTPSKNIDDQDIIEINSNLRHLQSDVKDTVCNGLSEDFKADLTVC